MEESLGKKYIEILLDRQATIAKNAAEGHVHCQLYCPEVSTIGDESSNSSNSSSSSSSSSSSAGGGGGGVASVLPPSPPPSGAVESSIPTEYQGLGDLELLNILSKLQAERIQIYTDYDSALDIIIKDGSIGKYPSLCAEITSLFAVVSKSIINIKNTIVARGDKLGIASDIQAIQMLEKDKLLVTAALHLDLIREKYPDLQVQYGSLVSDQPLNHIRKIADFKSKISVIMEKISQAKCDIIDEA